MAFYFVATSVITLVGDSLYLSRTREETATAEALAVRFAPYASDHDVSALYAQAVEQGKQLGGRVLVLDTDGKVQVDSFSTLNGVRLAYGEVRSILSGEQDTDAGFHRMNGDGTDRQSWLDRFLRPDLTDAWVGYFTASMIHEGNPVGLVLYSSSIQDLVDSLRQMRDTMLMYFGIAALSVVVFSFFVSRWITRPIAALSRGIERMAKGDFSGRVVVKGGSEMARLAQTFNEMAEKVEHLDQTRNKFVSNASHELKTPLTTMKIMLESLIYQDDMDPVLRAEFLGDINKEIDRLSMIIGDLLTLVQIDSHKMVLHREVMRMEEAVKEAVRRLSPLAAEREQDIQLQINDEGLMFADGAKIQQVVYNIVDNAIKYTPAGGSIRVSLSRSGKEAVLRVEDTGVGIPAEDVAHIFDRFYRVDKARSRDTGGTGLGLSIVQQIVRLHGGSIRAESEPGRGTVFTVLLPLK